MEHNTSWTYCVNLLPPDGEVVDTRSPGGMEQQLKRSGNLWFVPDGSMYVYYTPVAWRRPAPKSHLTSTRRGW